jgi:hypothetical protein
MESMGIPIPSLGMELELTIATPGSRNGLHNSSSSGSGGKKLISDSFFRANQQKDLSSVCQDRSIMFYLVVEDRILYYNIYMIYSLDALLIVVIYCECTDGYKGSHIEKMRELTLLDVNDLATMNGGREEVDAQITNIMEKGGEQDIQVVGGGLPSQPRKCRRLSKAHSGLLEASFEQNNYPDKVTSTLE